MGSYLSAFVFRFCLGVSVLLSAGAANASMLSLWQFDFVGDHLVLDDPTGAGPSSLNYTRGSVAVPRLSFRFDERLFGKRLAGHTLQVSSQFGAPTELVLQNGAGDVAILNAAFDPLAGTTPFSQLSLFGVNTPVQQSSCAIRFDAAAQIDAFNCKYIHSVPGYLSIYQINDQVSYHRSMFGETVFQGTPQEVTLRGEYFAAPGSWVRNSMAASPAPVPLPATFGLLVGCLLVVRGLGRLPRQTRAKAS